MLSPAVLTWLAKVASLTNLEEVSGHQVLDEAVRFHLLKSVAVWESEKPAERENRTEAAKRIKKWFGNLREPLDLMDCNLTTMPTLRPDIEQLKLPAMLETLPTELIQHIGRQIELARDLQSLVGASPVARRALENDKLLQNDRLVERAEFLAVQARFKEAVASGIVPPRADNLAVITQRHVPTLAFFCGQMRHLAPFQQGRVVNRIVPITDQAIFGQIVKELAPDPENPSLEERRRLLEAIKRIEAAHIGHGWAAEQMNAAFGALAEALPVYSETEREAFIARIPAAGQERNRAIELARAASFDGLAKGVIKLEGEERLRYADILSKRAKGMWGVNARFICIKAVVTHLMDSLSLAERRSLFPYIFSPTIENERKRAELLRPFLKDPTWLLPAQIDRCIQTGVDAATDDCRSSVADGLSANPACLSMDQLQQLNIIISSVTDMPERGRLTGNFAPKLHLLKEKRAATAGIVMGLLQSIDDMAVLARTIQAFVNQAETLTPAEKQGLTVEAARLPEGKERDEIHKALA